MAPFTAKAERACLDCEVTVVNNPKARYIEEAIVRKRFPEFKGRTESEIRQILYAEVEDRSFHSDYSISYGPVHAGYTEYQIASLNFREISRWNRHGKDEFDCKQFFVQGDSCWGDLPAQIARHYRIFGKPKWLIFSFRTNPFEAGCHLGQDPDDYYYDEYDEPEYDGRTDCLGEDLSYAEIRKYHDWLVKAEIINPFDVDKFIDYDNFGYGYLDLNRYNNINNIYFACVLMRYMHEGQNVVRRILAFDELYNLDPYVNIFLSHLFADRNYNGGHCICDWAYFGCEHFGGDYWHMRKDDLPEDYIEVPTAWYAQVAWAMRELFENGESDEDAFPWMGSAQHDFQGYPYFKYEQSVSKLLEGLDIQTLTPGTWRALLAYDTRRKPCVSIKSDVTQNSSSKRKKAA